MHPQAAEIERLRARVEKQGLLLEDRCEVERAMRAKEKEMKAKEKATQDTLLKQDMLLKATQDTVAELRAANAALSREKLLLSQGMAQVAKERDQARADHLAASSDTTCMHAMLQDAGRYIEHLRQENAVLQASLQHARAETMSFAQYAAHAHAAAEDIKASASKDQGEFAMDNMKQSIETAVEEIKGLG